MPVRDALLERIILASQFTPLRARGGYSNVPVEQQASVTGVDKAKAEAADFARFFEFFPDQDIKAGLRGKVVLDFGSGYGGRTVELARQTGTAMVHGTEPVESHVESGKKLADEWNVRNVAFDLCSQAGVPYPDAMFDVIVTFDVLEHVDDPRVSLRELKRVLKPGGVIYAVFPLYRGMFSHHLNYITLTPALHLLFRSDRIVRVVNRLLEGRFSHIAVAPQSASSRHYRSGQPILPGLNGMGLRDFQDAASIFETESLTVSTVADLVFGGRSMVARMARPLSALPPALSEIFSFNVSAVLKNAA